MIMLVLNYLLCADYPQRLIFNSEYKMKWLLVFILWVLTFGHNPWWGVLLLILLISMADNGKTTTNNIIEEPQQSSWFFIFWW